jgi:DNA-binding MarR family transcriptional regulator
MLLEKEIHQNKFRSTFHKLAVNMNFTYGWFMQRQKKIFKRFGLSGAQFNILRILRGKHPEPASVNYLKERMLDKMSDASRIVDKLFNKGLVIRKICNSDRRRAEVKITEKGLDLLNKIDQIENEFDEVFINLTENESEILNNLLDKMRG